MISNGVCCMRIKDPDATENKCQWLSNGDPITDYPVSFSEHNCQIVTFKFSNRKFEYSR